MTGGEEHAQSTRHVSDTSQLASTNSANPIVLITRGSNGFSSESSTGGSPRSDDVTSDLESGLTQDRGQEASSRPGPGDDKDPSTAAKAGKTYDLEIDRLSYCVSKKTFLGKGQKRWLLRGVSATANHGQILAVAGASGAGKTTFLDAVAGNINPASLKGSILVNGQPANGSFRRVSGYVTQEDYLLPMLTVRETLLFSARLRLLNSMALQEKVARVEALLTQLGLTACSDTLVGNADLRGISGGERRRTSIGVDLVQDPCVLFLDEPTSGLDSAAALGVMQILENLAQKDQRTIILTIHQPSARILKLIDRFLILSGGRVVYHGPYCDLSSHFEKLVGPRDCEEMNALEFALDAIRDGEKVKLLRSSLDLGSRGKQSTSPPPSPRGGCLVEEGVGESASGDTPAQDNSKRTKQSKRATKGSLGTPSHEYACNFFTEVMVLSERSVKTVLRTKELFLARILIFILCGLIAGTLFLNSGQNLEGANNRLSFFAYTIAAAFFTSTDAIPAFLEERWIYIRETSRGAYRPVSYAVAGAVVYAPFLLIIAIVYSVIPYYMIGLAPGFVNFVVFTSGVFLSLLVANSFVSFVASVVPNFTLGSAMSTALSALFFLFSGFFISESKIPLYWVWMNYISTFKYPLQLLILNEFGGTPDKCWNYAQGPSGEETEICTFSSQDVLEKFSVDGVPLLVPALVMVLFYVVYRGLFYVMLKFQTSQTRG